MRRRRGHAAAFSCFILVTSAAALAEQPTPLQVELEYSVDLALGCPESAELRTEVASQLGYDPFAEAAVVTPQRLRVGISHVNGTFDGRIEWVDAQGQSEGERRLSSTSSDCTELSRGLVFAVAVQIQLRAAAAAPADAASKPPTPEQPSSPLPAPQRPKSVIARSRPTRSRAMLFGLGVAAEHGLTPDFSVGALAFGAVTWGRAWLEAGVQATLPTKLELGDGTGFKANELSLWLAPCVRTPPFGWCAATRLGKLQVRGYGVDNVRRPSALVAAVGGRVELLWPELERTGVLVHAELLATLTSRDVILNQTRVWSTAPVVASLGVALPVIFR